MTKKINSTTKPLWDAPWGYTESFLIGTGLLITGFFLEYFVANGKQFSFQYPANIYFMGFYVAILVFLYKKYRATPLILWLTRVPASISSIVLVTAMVMIMGIIPQVPSNNEFITQLGLNKITSNYAFLFILFQFLTCLGLVTIKRIFFFNFSNIGFILNHFGLFLALIAGVMGSGDLKRLSIETFENKPSWVAYDENNNPVELPFAFYLKDFSIEEYQPKLALIENKTGTIVNNQGKNMFLIENNQKYTITDFEIKINKFFSNSGKIGDRYEQVNEMGSPPAAQITVKNVVNNQITEGWISSGSFVYPYQSLKIDEKYSLVMTIPEVKKFQSDVDILTQKGERISTILEVNKPFNYGGYKIYQLSYNEKMGKWSNLSVIELVKDPWLPVVYTGIFLMIAGALNMFWMGSKITKTTKNDLD